MAINSMDPALHGFDSECLTLDITQDQVNEYPFTFQLIIGMNDLNKTLSVVGTLVYYFSRSNRFNCAITI